MNLGDLAFTRGDIIRAMLATDPSWVNDESEEDMKGQKVILDIFNKVLAEKLEKADKVWGYEDRDFGVMVYFDDEETAYKNTHTARLVCLEALDGK